MESAEKPFRVRVHIMKVMVSGSTGFIGKHLVHALSMRGWDVHILARDDFNLGEEKFIDKLEGHKTLIHLAGAPIIRRWSEGYKKELYSSRIDTTHKISLAVRRMRVKPEVFISTSAVGIYKGERTYSENNAEYDQGFLGNLCRDWEHRAEQVSDLTRVVIFRMGVVLGRDGGALKKMYLPFYLGMGGVIGRGTQFVSWVHIDDVIAAYLYAIDNDGIFGVFNLTAPAPVNNREFVKTLGSVLRRPAVFPIPSSALRLIYGEGATVLTGGQKVVPTRLIESGFRFRFVDLRTALEDVFGKMQGGR
jgi:uncharacterized protein (TIGR01777 family)